MISAEARRKLRRIAIGLGGLTAAVLLLIWYALTQPLLGGLPAVAGGAQADPDRLREDVVVLAEEMVPRDFAHPEGLERVAGWLQARFRALGATVEVQSFDQDRFHNVIARFGPASEEIIVVGAHYDAAGPLPGADDNASGVAGLLELARLLSTSSLSLRVELVAYTLEEPPSFQTPMMGSAVHAEALSRAGVAVRGMICLEMIGYYSDAPDSQTLPSVLLEPLFPSTGNFIAVIGLLGDGRLVRRVKGAMRAAGELPVESLNGPRVIPGVDFSDHSSYWDRDYPAVMITDTAFYRNPNYHRVTDRPDTLDYQRMAEVVRQLHAAVLDLQREPL